jgi:flagellar basal-body rod modification protein FlgD
MPDISSSSSFLNSVQVPATNTNSTASQAASTSTTTSTAGPASLGKNDFLKLLLAELQNQDPSKPMDDSQTIAQMAQFSALEATQNLQQTIQQSNNVQTLFGAGALIGKYVQANQSDGTSVTGTVSSVAFTTNNGVTSPALVVNGTDIDYSTIVKVSSTPIATVTGSSSSAAASGSSSSSSSNSTSPTTGQ